jgi:5-methyltetrahydrofolate--homocysteine methyltransferase
MPPNNFVAASPPLLCKRIMSYPKLPYPIESYTRGAEFARLLGKRMMILDGHDDSALQIV